MRTREEALAIFREWEREDIEQHYFYLPKSFRSFILKVRMKSVERKLNAGKLNSYM